jgi:hypothetical protein
MQTKVKKNFKKNQTYENSTTNSFSALADKKKKILPGTSRQRHKQGSIYCNGYRSTNRIYRIKLIIMKRDYTIEMCIACLILAILLS